MANQYTDAQLLKDMRLFELPDDGRFTQAQIKRRRGLLMQKYHPDKGGTNEKAQEINESYERLSAWIEDAGRRRKQAARRQRASQSLRTALGLLLFVGSSGYIAFRWRTASRQRPTQK